MKKRITFLTAAIALLVLVALPAVGWGQTTVASFSRSGSTNTITGGDFTTTFSAKSGYYQDATGNCYMQILNTGAYWTTTPTSISFAASIGGGTDNKDLTNPVYVSLLDVNGDVIANTQTTVTSHITTNTGDSYVITMPVVNNVYGVKLSHEKESGYNVRYYSFSLSYVANGGSNPPAPTTYTVTYNANGGTGTMTDSNSPYNAGATVTVLGNEFTRTGYDFDHWNTAADDSGISYDEDDTFTINANTTLYAQWTENTTPGGDEQWVLTSLADLTTDDVFVIVGNNGSNYAMSNDKGTGSAPATSAVTITGNEITSTVVDNIQWTVSGNSTNGYTFYPNGSTTTWLYCNTTASSSSNNNMRVGTGDRKVFELNSSNILLTKDDYTTRYLSIYNNADWRGYVNTNSAPAISFYKKVTGGVVPPSISAANVEIAYDATAGSIAYSINNGVEGGSISATTTSDWLTLGNDFTSPIAFTCSANEAAAARTATVTLSYSYNRETVTKDVTVTQAGDPNAVMTIAEVRAQGTGAVVARGVVTSITGSNNKTAYIQDATAAIVVYGDFTAAVGDEIRVSGTLQDYNGLLEITSPTVTVLTSGNTINPELMTIAEAVASTNQGWYIRIENAIVTAISGQNTTIAQGENTIVVRGISGVEIEVDDVISLNGNIGYYNGNQIANPQNVEVQQSTNPSITIDPATLNVDAQQHLVNYFSLTYENIVVENTQSFTVHYYNAEGQEIQPAQGEMWMIAGVAKLEAVYQVLCTIIANEGDARTAYFKVSAQDADNNTIYSNLVTVNQEAYVELENYAVFTGNLIEGDYLIVYNDHAMNNVVSSDRLQYENVEAVNDVISTNNASIIWHIAPSGDYWTIYSADANAYAASTGAKNKAQMLADGTDDKALWTVEGMETFEFVNKANTEAGVNANLRNNGTYGFACYSTSTGGALTLYKKVTSTATYTLNITGYGNNEGGYYLIASPIYGLNPANVEGMTDGDFDLYYYDQTQVSQEWRNYKAGAFQYLTPGKGYLYAHKTDTNLTFTGMPYEGDGVVTLNAGCNLVGNPFGQVAYINKPFYTLNAEGSELISDPIGGAINPMEGVFVVADTDGENLTFSTTPTSNSNGRVIMNVYSSRSNVIDRAIVRFDENTTLPKFQLNPNSTKLYIPQDDVDYAVIYSQANGEIPVSFKVATNGTYTLGVNTTNIEMDYLHLIDNMTGEDVDLLANPNYTFNARTSDYAQRFRLVFGTDSVNENNAETFAFFNGSEWQISNVGEATLQVVDVMGRVLKSETVNGNATISTNGLCAGVYMMRLVNGNDVKVQKIVVR